VRLLGNYPELGVVNGFEAHGHQEWSPSGRSRGRVHEHV
jgi:hypothetical protein